MSQFLKKSPPPGKTAPPPNSQVKHVTISPESRWPIKPINMNGNLTIRLNLRICKENLFCFRGDPDSDLDLATSYPNSKFIAILPGDLIQAVQVDLWPKSKKSSFHIVIMIMWGSIIIIMWGSIMIMVTWGSWFFFQDELNSKSRELFNDCQKAVKDFLGGAVLFNYSNRSINQFTHQSINQVEQRSRSFECQCISIDTFRWLISYHLPLLSPTTFPEFCSVVTTIWLPVHSDQPFLPQSLPFQLSHHLIFFVQDRF